MNLKTPPRHNQARTERLPKEAINRRRQEAVEKWRGTPPGIPSILAAEFELSLRNGRTIRDLVDPPSEHYLVPATRFRTHCRLHPEWSALMHQLSDASTSAKKKIYTHFGCKTAYCVSGRHLMKGHNILRDRYGNRRCRKCQNEAHGKPMTPEEKDRIKDALRSGKSLSEICHGRPTGGGPVDRSLVIIDAGKLYHERKIDPEFAKFVEEHIAYTNSIGQIIRYARGDGESVPSELLPTIAVVSRVNHRLRTMDKGRFSNRLKSIREKRRQQDAE